MAERSRFWDGTTLGDATVAPYDAATEFSEVMMAISGTDGYTNRGVMLGSASGALQSSIPVAGTLRVAAGAALVYGAWYDNTANVDITVPTPSVSTRIDRIVLRKSWAAQTVRITRIAGAEGGAAPALVQTAGTTWDLPLCQVSTTTGGVNTITDQRNWSLGVGTAVSPWHPSFPVVQIGGAAAAWGMAGNPGMWLTSNSYYNGTNRLAVYNAAGVEFTLAAAGFTMIYYPSVAANNVQTPSTMFTFSPDSGNNAILQAGGVVGDLYLRARTAAQTVRLDTGPVHVSGTFRGGGVATFDSNVLPVFDTSGSLGGSGLRWAAVWAANGTIQTSSREAKTDFSDVSDIAALNAVLATPITRFRYRAAKDQVSAIQVGFVAEDADPLLVLSDGKSVNAQHTASVALAAIRALAAEVAELRKKLAN